MPRLPDRFDLWIRKARECPDPERQLDYILGAMIALPDWYFLNLGTRGNPQPASGEVEGQRVLLVFSDADRVLEAAGDAKFPCDPPVISVPAAAALKECLGQGAFQCDALMINPGEHAALIPREQVAAFEREWQARGAEKARGYWIPNLTSEEEDFWQEHGL